MDLNDEIDFQFDISGGTVFELVRVLREIRVNFGNALFWLFYYRICTSEYMELEIEM